jgi:hypothetical protein
MLQLHLLILGAVEVEAQLIIKEEVKQVAAHLE